MANRWGNNGNSLRLILGAPKSLQMVTAAMNIKDACSLEEKLWHTQIAYKKQRRYFANKDLSNHTCDFSSSHVWMWEFDNKESWAQKNWCFLTVVLEKTIESPLDCKEIQPVHPKGDQSWMFIGRTDVEAETPVLWPPDVKSWLIWKDPDAGKVRARGEGNDRGWDGWMASPIQWTSVWVDSRSWWWTGRPSVLRFMGMQRVRHDWVTELLLNRPQKKKFGGAFH